MTGVVWLANTAATRQHAVLDDTIVPRGQFQTVTVCRPSRLTALIPPGRVLGDPLPKCRACLNRLPACGAHLTPRTDPPPPGDDVVSPAARAGTRVT